MLAVGRGCRRRCGATRLQVRVEPPDPALEPIALVARHRDPVVLAGIDHELALDAVALQRLIHLLGADERHVEVLVAAHVERRRLDPIRVEERVAAPSATASWFFHGCPISVSYCTMYWSTPYIVSCSARLAPEMAALKRVSLAIV